MKKIITLFLFAGLILLYSCGGEAKETEATDEEVNVENVDVEATEDVENLEEFDADELGDASNCDEFLDEYEVWVLAYIELMEKYIKNPMDMNLAKEYMEVVQGAAKWSTDWIAMAKCAQDDKYQARFDEISEKAEKKMEDLGL